MKTERDSSTPSKSEAGSNSKRILLVDDHPMMRAGLAQLIDKQSGLKVCCEASQAAEALALMQKHAPDLVITDITMPGRGGLELIKDIHVQHPKVPVLVISMHDELLHAERVLRAGAKGYIMKESGAEKMLEAIRHVLDGQIYVSEQMASKIFATFSGHQSRIPTTRIEKLSDREFEVFQLIGNGLTTRAIATQLNLSTKTVDAHREHIKEKLQIGDAPSLIRYAVRWVETQGHDAST